MRRSSHDLDDEAWNAEIAVLIPRLLPLAVRLCQSLPLAEEAMQEALLRITRHRDSFRGDCQLSTYVTRIVINSCRDLIDKERKHTKVGLESVEEPSSRSFENPSEQASVRDLEKAMQAAVGALPQRQREVLSLIAWDQRSPAEVAELLDMSIQNVYATLSQARQRMQLWLDRNIAKEERA